MTYDDRKAWRDAEEMGMSIYYMFILKKGPIWSPDSTPEIEELQAAHLANYYRLKEEGKLMVTGPFLDSFQISGEMRGAGILKAKSYNEAYEWVDTDPMVKVGRLVFVLHTWMIGKDVFA
ncbi:MAG: hypothetical protein C4557_02025 [Anaerolineaceae bacterium]|jgi:uncharacterized protein YciI|nr:MAG: hypothetical protein C4557_02025 [Anaerolineaceae bacterium]